MEEKRIGNIYGFTGGNYAYNVYDSNNLCPTLNSMQGGGRQPMIATEQVANQEIIHQEKFQSFLYKIGEEIYLIRIRKLTPKECWRLMGFSDEDFLKAEQVNSNTQLYKQAGNSIVKNVLMSIFQNMM